MQADLVVACAQVSSVRGDLEVNVASHLRFIDAAAAVGVDLLVFPELSLTGYEPDLGARLQLAPNDPAIGSLRQAAGKHDMHVVVGGPLKSAVDCPYLGAFVLSRDEVVTYAKIYVHESELPYFVCGNKHCVVPVRGIPTGLAICADSSFAEHAAAARRSLC